MLNFKDLSEFGLSYPRSPPTSRKYGIRLMLTLISYMQEFMFECYHKIALSVIFKHQTLCNNYIKIKWYIIMVMVLKLNYFNITILNSYRFEI